MFFKDKRLDKIENDLSVLRTTVGITVENINGLVKLAESLNTRLNLQQDMIASLSRQIDLIVDAIFKTKKLPPSEDT